MNTKPFTENVIAIIWDFDKTLIKGSMQSPLFAHYDVDETTFWQETNNLADYYAEQGYKHLVPDTIYLNHMLSYVKHGVFKGLNNATLRELGKDVGKNPPFFPGVKDLFPALKRFVEEKNAEQGIDVKVEHYIISTGLQEMIEGSDIRHFFKDVWGCTFIEDIAPPGYFEQKPWPTQSSGEINQLGFVIDNTSKTRCIFEINKGVNVHPDITVNSHMPHESRRVPFENMIYVADGISDIPVFSLVKQYGGRTLAVYDPESSRGYDQAEMMLEDDRVHHFCPADFREGQQAHMWLSKRLEKMITRIAQNRSQSIASSVSKPMGHPKSGKDD